ncbi:MAG: GNAT family N-acetyltransferase [Pseudomonadota bacterium]
MAWRVERALIGDADAIAAVLVQSITDLCGADHQDDPEIIARWTANKTGPNMRRAITSDGAIVLVSRVDGGVACVGMAAGDQVLLNYVAPPHQRSGHSKAVLAALESRMKTRGVTTARLTSTKTAHAFYQKAGWQDCGTPQVEFGLKGFPMTKAL